jgi:hypothetical protein
MHPHRPRHHRRHYRRHDWLWIVALAIVAVGSFYWYLLSSRPESTVTRTRMAYVLTGTLLGAGLCVILATKDWWIRR